MATASEAENDESNGTQQGCAEEGSTQAVDEAHCLGIDDDATVATAKYSLNGDASYEKLTAWALAKISTIDPIQYRASRSSLFSDDGDDEEDEESNEAASSDASLSSMKGLENISVASDVILPFRYSYRTFRHGARSPEQELDSPEDFSSGDLEKGVVGQLDVTSDTTSSSTPSSQSNRSSCESVYEADDDGADDVDSDMTLGEAASEIIDYTNESDDDLESKASSSRFTPDEFWDWMDNVQVAFIEVGNGNLRSKRKSRGASSIAVSKAIVGGAGEPSEEPSFSDSLQTTEQHQVSSLNKCDYLRDEGHDEKESYRFAPSHRTDESLHENEFAPKPVPLLKHSASVADFRSHSEQDQQAHHMLSCNMRRTVSFADVFVEKSPFADEPDNEGAARMRRISSNEDLLLTLHQRAVPTRIPESAPLREINAVVSMPHSEGGMKDPPGALVCYEPRWVRTTRKLLVLVSAIYVLAFTASNLANLFVEELPATCMPRTVTVDLDTSFIPSLEEVSGTFESSTTAAVGAFHLLKDNLPETLDDVNALLAESKMSAIELYNHLKDHLTRSAHNLKPQMAFIDVQNHASVAYQEAGEVLKAARVALEGALLSHSERLSDQQWKESIDRLESTLARARAALLHHLSELCRSSSMEGPKRVVFGACDALYETVAATRVTTEDMAEPGPPQLICDRPFIRRSFDQMANETLAFIGRFATAIHDFCSEVQDHCRSIPSTAFYRGLRTQVPLADSTPENLSLTEAATCGELLLPIVGPIASETAHPENNQSEERVSPRDAANEYSNASVRDSIDASGTSLATPGLSDHSNGTGGSNGGRGEVEVSQRVREILSNLDAKGRLSELESLLVEKFGPDSVDPPSTSSFERGNIGFMPLLGRERDRELRERLLNRLENEVVEAALRGRTQSFISGFNWAAHIKVRVQSIGNIVSSGEEAGKDRKGDE